MIAPPRNSANLLNGSKVRTGVFFGGGCQGERKKGETIDEDEALEENQEDWGLDPEGQEEAPEGRGASTAPWDFSSLRFQAAHRVPPCPQVHWSLSSDND